MSTPPIETIAPLSPVTEALVRRAAEAAIEAEYGTIGRHVVIRARISASRAISEDCRAAYMAIPGANEAGLRGYGEHSAMMAIVNYLAARVCAGLQCDAHTEADAPEVDGEKYCGDCYADIVECVEIGADGCGCPIIEDVSPSGASIDDTERVVHRERCWAAS